jgi:hypothetical protein
MSLALYTKMLTGELRERLGLGKEYYVVRDDRRGRERPQLHERCDGSVEQRGFGL